MAYPSVVFLGGTWSRAIALAAVAASAAAVALVAHGVNLLRWLERPSVDARFALRGRTHPPSDVLVVGIDNETLHVLGGFPGRSRDGEVIERLHRAGAKLIVEDVEFAEHRAGDAKLFAATERAAPVVFSTTIVSSTGASDVMGGEATRNEVGAITAYGGLRADGDGVVRHTLAQVNGLPSIATAVARALGVRGPGRQPGGGWIDFPGPPGTVRSLSFANVLRGSFDPATVRGRVVVVGATAPVRQDLHSTSAGGPMPGPEIQAAAVSTTLHGFPLRDPAGFVTALLIVALSLLAPIAALRLQTAAVVVLALVAMVLFAVATQLSFNHGVVLDFSDSFAALGLSSIGAVLLSMRADASERKRLRLAFAAGHAPLVQEVLNPERPAALSASAVIAGYQLESAIGRGGMGVVYRAKQLALDREVAVKLIATERAQDAVFRERFKAESRIASSIEHPNVIPVYEAGEDDGLLFIAMRLVDGVDLGQLLASEITLAPARAVRLLVQIAGALEAAHARGLVHRDVKPANVLVTVSEPEHAYLTDFGVALRTGAANRVTRTGQWVGSLDYVAPEQIRGEQIGTRADVYSLTALFYHCLCGEAPFVRESDSATLWAHMTVPPPRVSHLRPGLPAALDEIVGRGLAKHPDERYTSATALAWDCATALGVELGEWRPDQRAEPAVSGAALDDRAGTLQGAQRITTAASSAAGAPDVTSEQPR